MSKIEIVVGAVLLVLILSMPCCHYAFCKATGETIILTVKDKESISGQSGHTYMVYCEAETFINADSLWYWKWGSADLYSDIKEGVTYKAHVYGWRLPFFSVFRNITSLEEVQEATEQESPE